MTKKPKIITYHVRPQVQIETTSVFRERMAFAHHIVPSCYLTKIKNGMPNSRRVRALCQALECDCWIKTGLDFVRLDWDVTNSNLTFVLKYRRKEISMMGYRRTYKFEEFQIKSVEFLIKEFYEKLWENRNVFVDQKEEEMHSFDELDKMRFKILLEERRKAEKMSKNLERSSREYNK